MFSASVYFMIYCSTNNQLSFYFTKDIAAPESAIVPVVHDGFKEIAFEFEIESAKTDNDQFITFSTKVGSLLETQLKSKNANFVMSLWQPPQGKLVSAYFSKEIIVSQAESPDGGMIGEIFLSKNIAGQKRLFYVGKLDHQLNDFTVQEVESSGEASKKFKVISSQTQPGTNNEFLMDQSYETYEDEGVYYTFGPNYTYLSSSENCAERIESTKSIVIVVCAWLGIIEVFQLNSMKSIFTKSLPSSFSKDWSFVEAEDGIQVNFFFVLDSDRSIFRLEVIADPDKEASQQYFKTFNYLDKFTQD